MEFRLKVDRLFRGAAVHRWRWPPCPADRAGTRSPAGIDQVDMTQIPVGIAHRYLLQMVITRRDLEALRSERWCRRSGVDVVSLSSGMPVAAAHSRDSSSRRRGCRGSGAVPISVCSSRWICSSHAHRWVISFVVMLGFGLCITIPKRDRPFFNGSYSGLSPGPFHRTAQCSAGFLSLLSSIKGGWNNCRLARA